MKPTPAASTASTSSAAAAPSSARPTNTTATSAAPRVGTGIDYRANVERQSREQKSVGNLLAYILYGFIAVFVLGAALAGYGIYTLSKQIRDQSVTVSDLDARYSAANKDLTAKLATTQDTLTEAQAQIARQQDVILKQQDEINRLLATTTDNANAIKQEKLTRTQEAAVLRARVRDLEYRANNPQKF